MRILFLVGLVAGVLVGCAASSGSVEPTSVPPSDSGTPKPSLQPSSEQPTRQPTGEPLTGVLGADSIEGGCGYLQADDGTRYEVIYPDGWELTLSPLELRAPDGTVRARGGDQVTVIGEVAGDMASICQIGPIFRAEAVEGTGS